MIRFVDLDKFASEIKTGKYILVFGHDICMYRFMTKLNSLKISGVAFEINDLPVLLAEKVPKLKEFLVRNGYVDEGWDRVVALEFSFIPPVMCTGEVTMTSNDEQRNEFFEGVVEALKRVLRKQYDEGVL